MPVFSNYSAEGKFINTIKEPLNEGNVERFVLEDQERAKIYLEALEEFTESIRHMVIIDYPAGVTGPQSPYMARKLLTEMYNHNNKILDVSKKITNFGTAGKPDIPNLK